MVSRPCSGTRTGQIISTIKIRQTAYQKNDVVISGGVSFSSDTVCKTQNDVALSLPTGDEWLFATGAQYQITPQSNIGFAVSYLNMQSSRVQSPEQFKGSYDNPYLWFASLNYSYQF
ncbi:outer membrane protein transport protein [Enterobacter dykesii]|uniref:outer membrane protein transport protein n=1 Tax=Enterobacter dykesii TaxID=2797506 RepID=UPI0023ED08BC|nr:outer membrane protein transport protein [Enterobacter dykesii]